MAMPPQFQPPTPGYAPAAGVGGDYGPPPEKIEVMRAVKFLISDPTDGKTNWLYATLIQLIPVVGPISMLGWQAEITQRLARNHPKPIPKYDFGDFTHYLTRGLIPFVAQLLAVFPIIFVWYFFMVIATMLVGVIGGAIGSPELTMIMLLLFSLVGYLVLVVMMTVFVSAIMLRAELTEDFGKTLQFGAIFRYAGKTWKRSLGYGLLLGLIAFGMGMLGMLACFIGLYFVVSLLSFANLHLRYQIYAAYLAEGGEPIPVKEPQTLPSEVSSAGYARQQPMLQQGQPGGYGPSGGGYGPPPGGGGYGPPPGGYGPPPGY
ncbi:MAG: DUF4013 domain-containing protein [Myxococcales bacterium]|nr:DUF4013 domain-containing protein [Myxococcales bacterium]